MANTFPLKFGLGISGLTTVIAVVNGGEPIALTECTVAKGDYYGSVADPTLPALVEYSSGESVPKVGSEILVASMGSDFKDASDKWNNYLISKS
jgi:hypothetical protein